MIKRKADITVSTFESLEYSSKIELLYNEGIYVGKRKLNRLIAVLYQVESFYVEVFFAKYRRKVKCFCISESTHVLNPYLEQIDVCDLVIM